MKKGACGARPNVGANGVRPMGWVKMENRGLKMENGIEKLCHSEERIARRRISEILRPFGPQNDKEGGLRMTKLTWASY